MNKRLKSKFPLVNLNLIGQLILKAKIKKIIQSNEEIGKMQNAMPNIICQNLNSLKHVQGKSLELFLTKLLTDSMKVAEEHGKNKLTGSCIKKVIDQNDHLKFLKSITNNFPDVENEQKKKPTKRSQKEEEGEEMKTKKKVKTEKKYEELSDLSD